MNSSLRYILFFILAGLIFFFPYLGAVPLFDWDEINFAEIAREMMIVKEYLRIYVNYEPFWEKPPLFFWMQVVSMKIWGIGEYAARFPNAVCGLATLVVLFLIGKKLHDSRFGYLWALAYFGSVLPHMYFRSSIIDPWFNLFIFLGIYGFIRYRWIKRQFEGIETNKSQLYFLIFSGLMLGLGVLTKGQVAYLVFFLTTAMYWLWGRGKNLINIPNFILVSCITGLVMLGWYGLETLKHGPWFVLEFTKYQASLFSAPSAGHDGFPGYHFVVLLFGVFPASVFGLATLIKSRTEKPFEKDFYRWMHLFFWVVLILFTMARSKIVHYSSLCYFPITYFAAIFFYQWIEGKRPWKSWTTGFLLGIGSLYALAPILLTIASFNQDLIQSYLQEGTPEWAAFNMEVHWTGFEVIPGILMILVLIATMMVKKRGLKKWVPWVIYVGTAVYVLFTIAFLVWRIERYSQGSHIDFLKQKAEENCYVHPSGFKSYAPLYYLQKMPHDGFDPAKKPDPSLGATFNIHKTSNEDWLYYGHVDKPVYIVSKYGSNSTVAATETMSEMYSEGSFIFYERTKYRPCQVWKIEVCPIPDSCDYTAQYRLNYEERSTSDNCYELKNIGHDDPYNGENYETLQGMLIESPPVDIPVEELQNVRKISLSGWVRGRDGMAASWLLEWTDPESGEIEKQKIQIKFPEFAKGDWFLTETWVNVPNIPTENSSLSIRLFNDAATVLDVDDLLIMIPKGADVLRY